MQKILVLIAVFLLAGGAAVAAQDDIRQAFLGTWGEGVWSGGGFLSTELIVNKIEGGEADAIYKHGTSAFWKIWEPGAIPVKGKFLNSRTLKLELLDDFGKMRAEITYTIQEDGRLNAKYTNRFGAFYATLKKLK